MNQFYFRCGIWGIVSIPIFVYFVNRMFVIFENKGLAYDSIIWSSRGQNNQGQIYDINQPENFVPRKYYSYNTTNWLFFVIGMFSLLISYILVFIGCKVFTGFNQTVKKKLG